MKIYIDDTNKLIGYEVVFYDKKIEKRPITNLDSGEHKRELFLSEKQNNFIRDYTDKGGKITQLSLNKDGTFTINKEVKKDVGCKNCPKTVLVSIKHYEVNADLSRHFKDKSLYTFKELDTIPFDSINEKYLYYFDKSILDFEKNGHHKIERSLKRFFGLFDKDTKLVAFIYLMQKENPTIMILYHDEAYNNAGYIILSYLIDLFKEEKRDYLDLGGLTKDESGINQFKNKFGVIIPIEDRKLFISK